MSDSALLIAAAVAARRYLRTELFFLGVVAEDPDDQEDAWLGGGKAAEEVLNGGLWGPVLRFTGRGAVVSELAAVATRGLVMRARGASWTSCEAVLQQCRTPLVW